MAKRFNGGCVQSRLKALLMLIRLQLPDRDGVIQDGNRCIAVRIGGPWGNRRASLCHFTHGLNIGPAEQRLKW
jgi:hypothetical protein